MSVESATSDPLTQARDAYGRHQWQDAHDLFTAANSDSSLDAPDLEALSQAAWFTGRPDEAIEAKEQAFKIYLANGDKARAGFVAMDLFNHNLHKGLPSIAAAWKHRGERILESEPESYATGYLALTRSFDAESSGDLEKGLAEAETAHRIGLETGDPDLIAHALMAMGAMKIAVGATQQGLALMEEAAGAAVNGELSPFVTGLTCCRMISAARDLTDYKRASEWTEATEKCCERNALSAFPGVCRIHRAEVTAISGAWEKAEQELRLATTELASFNADEPIADGLYAIGEIRLRQGDLEGAETALKEAHAIGRTPQPALALVRLGQGKARTAAAALNSALEEVAHNQWSRLRLLPTQVQLSIAIGDLAKARAATEELTEIVQTNEVPAARANKHESWGRLLLAEGDPVGAVRELRTAQREWRQVGAPYEVARVRAVLGAALRAAEDDDEADLELAAAHEEFVRLGAKLDAAATEKAIKAAAERSGGPVTTRKTFMFTDIVGSTNLAEALGNDAWVRLLQWHDDTLRGLVARHGGELVNSTGDGFFVSFDSAARGIECAVAIQRTLAEHRRTTGFAPPVRIGLHVAEANRDGNDYRGVGVHVAARVASAAGSAEIIATTETLDEAGAAFVTSEPRLATLKGVAEPVSVASINWEE